MAVALIMVRMRLAVLRNSMSGQRGGMMALGAVAGLVLAAGTVALALSDTALLAPAYTVWLLGRIFGPVFSGGGDETLRPEYFASLGLPARRLAVGLLVSAFAGVTPAVSALSLTGLVVAGVRQGPAAALAAIPALLLQLVVFVLASKVAVALFGLVLRSRVGAVGAGMVNGAILAVLGQIWVVFVAFGEVGGVPPEVTEPAAYLPGAWGLAAVEAVGAADWWRAAAALLGLAVLGLAVLGLAVLGLAVLGLAVLAVLLLAVLLLAAWAALLARRAGSVRAATRGRRPIRAATAEGAVLAKELRTWSRDLVRTHYMTFSLVYGVFFAGVPLLTGRTWMLPWAGPIFILMAAAMSANLYGTDGTALWLTLMTPRASDVRGRQYAWLLTVAPVAVALTLGLTAVAGGPWPLVLAVLLALLGGGAGMVTLVSVYAPVPGVDPHRRGGNPLRTTEDDGAATGMVYAVLALVALTAAPAAVAALLWGWAGVAAGAITGAFFCWGLGLLAERRLSSRGPELLHLLRTGRPDTPPRRPDRHGGHATPGATRGRALLLHRCDPAGSAGSGGR
ncbi:hypothetical protein ACQPZZ_32585 [Microbispora sp. CA-135349]|uniref:hypothetical protein n=1 Tax=Microbispora sp. CA-135349 TaxID=3239953 RepID=UPI003D91394E